MKGIQVHPDNPLLFDFIIDTGKSGLKIDGAQFKAESQKLIKYFLASLTIKEDDLWVNLSPYEKDRMITEELGKTELGRDMLAQDYILKQLTASLIYPEKGLGKKFWDRVYAKAQQQFGSSDIPVNTFNKVWIVADKAKILERNNTAFIVGSHLKVMLEEDYLSMEKHAAVGGRPMACPYKGQPNGLPLRETNKIGSQIIREIVLPEIEKEVNQGQNFAPLRQMFYSMILATWFKTTLKGALLNQVYSNKGKTSGVLSDDPSVKEKIYEQYLKAYKKGVFNYIKEDLDTASHQPMPRKYFSGGLTIRTSRAMTVVHNPNDEDVYGEGALAKASVKMVGRLNAAMTSSNIKDSTQAVRAGIGDVVIIDQQPLSHTGDPSENLAYFLKNLEGYKSLSNRKFDTTRQPKGKVLAPNWALTYPSDVEILTFLRSLMAEGYNGTVVVNANVFDNGEKQEPVDATKFLKSLVALQTTFPIVAYSTSFSSSSVTGSVQAVSKKVASIAEALTKTYDPAMTSSEKLVRSLFADWDKPVGEVASDAQVQAYIDATVAKYKHDRTFVGGNEVAIRLIKSAGVKEYVAGRISLGEAVKRYRRAQSNSIANKPSAEYLVSQRMAFLTKKPGSDRKWSNYISRHDLFNEFQKEHNSAMTVEEAIEKINKEAIPALREAAIAVLSDKEMRQLFSGVIITTTPPGSRVTILYSYDREFIIGQEGNLDFEIMPCLHGRHQTHTEVLVSKPKQLKPTALKVLKEEQAHPYWKALLAQAKGSNEVLPAQTLKPQVERFLKSLSFQIGGIFYHVDNLRTHIGGVPSSYENNPLVGSINIDLSVRDNTNTSLVEAVEKFFKVNSSRLNSSFMNELMQEMWGKIKQRASRAMNTNTANIETRIKMVLEQTAGIPPNTVTPQSKFADLIPDSLTAVAFVLDIEVEFKINIPDDDAAKLETLADLVKYVEDHTRRANPAMNTNVRGGIDLNAKNMGLDVDRQGQGVAMNFNQAMVAQFQNGNLTGVDGIILRIVPMDSPLPMLGLEVTKK